MIFKTELQYHFMLLMSTIGPCHNYDKCQTFFAENKKQKLCDNNFTLVWMSNE